MAGVGANAETRVKATTTLTAGQLLKSAMASTGIINVAVPTPTSVSLPVHSLAPIPALNPVRETDQPEANGDGLPWFFITDKTTGMRFLIDTGAVVSVLPQLCLK